MKWTLVFCSMITINIFITITYLIKMFWGVIDINDVSITNKTNYLCNTDFFLPRYSVFLITYCSSVLCKTLFYVFYDKAPNGLSILCNLWSYSMPGNEYKFTLKTIAIKAICFYLKILDHLSSSVSW